MIHPTKSHHITILKLSEVIELTRRSKTTLWQDCKDGIFPPSIKLGHKSVGYIEYEVQTVLHARAIGLTDNQVREVVSQLVEQRKQSASKLLQEYCGQAA